MVADPQVARLVAARLNESQRFTGSSESGCTAGGVYAAGLLHDLMHCLLEHFDSTVSKDVLAKARRRAAEAVGAAELERVSALFVDSFPPVQVFREEVSAGDWLRAGPESELRSNGVVEELLLVRIAGRNPALRPYSETFDDSELKTDPAFHGVVTAIEGLLEDESGPELGGRSLLDVLEEPMRVAPDSLGDQLRFVLQRWGDVIGPLAGWVLTGLDLLAEEEKPFFPPGKGPVAPPDYSNLDAEYEAYSADREWMPSVVMLAKNAFVWLEQLSRRFQRPIARLDEVPDEVLQELAGQGFTALWLIGVWKRSQASERIKRMMGDDDAVASAYALFDYDIAERLGGEDGWNDLAERAFRHGIRLATDMVPNHVGIDGRWVIEHPDWFIGLESSPFPSYTFSGPDLSSDERVGIFLEDHYSDRSDAAVVFKRVDRWTGSERYIYHGNDGTSMPWNDTAQLDYLKAEVREAVIQTILHVARKSSIIRFDAAMTLAKKHFHRLWYPEPGHGGDIASRAGSGLTRQEFDRHIPQEFWREVVDRVAAEAPDTLLLAEAFWLLEGYFVRTLGMHRVYNSAFMNMLRDESNDQYRQLIKSTLEFDPQILKRYVNFMSNPDEETALEQFGDGDKYFAVLTLLLTLPGLPMFGHGQIEGFAEKYGMEFSSPRWSEEPNRGLIARHVHQAFPIARRRWQFAEVEKFFLFDFERADGSVDENVLAYSNWVDDRRSVVMVHNRFAETTGCVKMSTAVVDKQGRDHGLKRSSLWEALELGEGEADFVSFRDAIADLEFLRSIQELKQEGLHASLRAYEAQVFLDFAFHTDHEDRPWARLHDELAGRGVSSLDREMKNLQLQPIRDPIRGLLRPERIVRLIREPENVETGDLSDLRRSLKAVYEDVARHFGETVSADNLDRTMTRLRDLIDANSRRLSSDELSESEGAADPGDLELAVAILLGALGSGYHPDTKSSVVIHRFDELDLGPILHEAFSGMDVAQNRPERSSQRVRLLLRFLEWYEFTDATGLAAFFGDLIDDPDVRAYLGVNRYEGRLWFDRESAFDLCDGLKASAEIVFAGDTLSQELENAIRQVSQLGVAIEESEYRIDRLLNELGIVR